MLTVLRNRAYLGEGNTSVTKVIPVNTRRWSAADSLAAMNLFDEGRQVEHAAQHVGGEHSDVGPVASPTWPTSPAGAASMPRGMQAGRRIGVTRHRLTTIAAVATPLLILGAIAARADSPSSLSRRAAPATTTASWNPHVSCVATVTTLAALLGTQRSSLGGATFAGGGFSPGVPDRRSITPPCSVGGKTTFVELHRVQMPSCGSIGKDGDWTCTVTDPSAPAGTPADLNHIHIETDGNFRAAGWSQPNPPGGTPLDIQGFVFWDPDHTTAGWHSHSGWELHSFTAWRRAQ